MAVVAAKPRAAQDRFRQQETIGDNHGNVGLELPEPIAVGLILSSGIILGEAAASSWIAVAMTVASTLFVWRTNRSPLWVLGVGGALGALFL